MIFSFNGHLLFLLQKRIEFAQTTKCNFALDEGTDFKIELVNRISPLRIENQVLSWLIQEFFLKNHAISHFDLSFPIILLLQMLGNILVFAKTMPSLFAPFYEDFFVNASDPHQTRALKLEILTIIATEPSIPAIFEEFQVIACSCNGQYIC